MKISIEPRKTTWVPFISSKAKLGVEWKAKAEYKDWSVRQSSTLTTHMRYAFSDLQGAQFIPSSSLIIKEEGIPLTITETVVSPAKDKFQTQWLEDPFVEIYDKLAGIEKSKVNSKRLSPRMIERTWVETIERSIRIENKTGKKVTLKLTITDSPAENVTFLNSTPAATSKEAPEYIFDLSLAMDAVQTLKLTFKVNKQEKLELPPERVPKSDRSHYGRDALNDDDEMAEEDWDDECADE